MRRILGAEILQKNENGSKQNSGLTFSYCLMRYEINKVYQKSGKRYTQIVKIYGQDIIFSTFGPNG